jgi:exopolyphosphatase/guanosine-5'-triphosphate,3'-diphosphate pyrophosphatase
MPQSILDLMPVRLLIVNIVEQEEKNLVNKSSLVRVPIRLRQDAFTVEC